MALCLFFTYLGLSLSLCFLLFSSLGSWSSQRCCREQWALASRSHRLWSVHRGLALWSKSVSLLTEWQTGRQRTLSSQQNFYCRVSSAAFTRSNRQRAFLSILKALVCLEAFHSCQISSFQNLWILDCFLVDPVVLSHQNRLRYF